MKHYLYRVMWLLLLCCTQVADAQIMPFADYMQIVSRQHPYSQRAQLLPAFADAQLREAQGAFEPLLSGDYSQKYFDQKNYYQYGEAQLYATTPSGIALKGGYLYSNGLFANADTKAPKSGLLYAGARLPLLQGFLTNKKNTLLRQARLYQTANTFEQQLMVQSVKAEAAEAYWAWYREKRLFDFQDSMLAITYTRLQAVKQLVVQGDRPAIDTLEAWLQWQNRTAELANFRQQFTNANTTASLYLWSDDQQPLLLALTALPESLPPSRLLTLTDVTISNNWIDQLLSTHPALQVYDFKLQQLALDNRLKRNALLPRLDVEYNYLSDANAAQLNPNNRKIGVLVEYPFLQRTARAQLQTNELKIQDTELARVEKRAELRTKLLNYKTEHDNLREQALILEQNIAAYRQLVAAEIIRFNNGESSLFMVYAREMALIDLQRKAIENEFKLLKAAIRFYEAAALL